MNFGDAIAALKRGEKVARAGWNGKGMWLTLNLGSAPQDCLVGCFIEGIEDRLFDVGAEGTTVRLPNIDMRTATGSTCRGWFASQADMLAEDWTVV